MVARIMQLSATSATERGGSERAMTECLEMLARLHVLRHAVYGIEATVLRQVGVEAGRRQLRGRDRELNSIPGPGNSWGSGWESGSSCSGKRSKTDPNNIYNFLVFWSGT